MRAALVNQCSKFDRPVLFALTRQKNGLHRVDTAHVGTKLAHSRPCSPRATSKDINEGSAIVLPLLLSLSFQALSVLSLWRLLIGGRMSAFDLHQTDAGTSAQSHTSVIPFTEWASNTENSMLFLPTTKSFASQDSNRSLLAQTKSVNDFRSRYLNPEHLLKPPLVRSLFARALQQNLTWMSWGMSLADLHNLF